MLGKWNLMEFFIQILSKRTDGQSSAFFFLIFISYSTLTHAENARTQKQFIFLSVCDRVEAKEKI